MSGDRTKFKYECKLIYGLHPEGILEIKFHDAKKRNSFFEKTMRRLGEILDEATIDDRIKCVVLHGGEVFSAGNDLEAFQIGRTDTENVYKFATTVLKSGLYKMLTSLANFEKPLIAVVRGFAIGLGFTMLSYADFVYCTPEAKFFTPFMQSFQSPEGGSTFHFPTLFGPRKAKEILLLDTPLSAADAQHAGFVNQVLP